MKMTLTQGVIFATLILATIGGALQVLATELQTVDLSWMGSYQTPFLAFFQNAWIIIVVTFLYNVFMYFRQNQLAALKQTAELYDWRKLVTTLAWFTGILGPMAALVSDVQVKGIISLIVVLATAFTQEISKIFSTDTNTQPSPTTTPQQTLPEGQIGTYQGWGVYIKNGYLMVYPPSSMVATLGQMMGLGSVQGYPPTTDFMSMAKIFIDQQIAQYNYQQAHPPNPAQEPQPPQPVTPAG
jgi:hypothetical protein